MAALLATGPDPGLAQQAAVLTDANFKEAVAQCVGRWDGSSWTDGEDPVEGNCVSSPFGPISGWDTSRVTDMRGAWHDADGPTYWQYGSALGGARPPAAALHRVRSDLCFPAANLVRRRRRRAVFFRAAAFNGDLSGWDVSAVTDMNSSTCRTKLPSRRLASRPL
eukprot:SAG22_NODE_1614_length_3993_cov_3.572419_3_plen_165_part_00